ncbi:MAG TPA: HDOD domain-containing protein [Candidatus Eisenbacteria bacterium]|nr:HDOD domain-containing protein [Candidatus Eisenbacteria bacterium]
MASTTVGRTALRLVAERTVTLPTFPAVASRLIEEVARPDATSEEIGKILSFDPALTARTLKLANSDFYGFPRKVGSVDLAVLVLGTNTIRDLVLTSSVVQAMGRTGSALEGLLGHAMASGIAARALAERAKYRLTGDAYAAGLLHDVGKVVLRESDPARFDQVLAQCRERGTVDLDAERKRFGSDHAEVGGWLAERWGLPADIVEAIACHHRPEAASRNSALASLVHIANFLAQRAGYPWASGLVAADADSNAWKEIEPHATRREGLVAELVSTVIRETEREKALFAEFRRTQEG